MKDQFSLAHPRRHFCQRTSPWLWRRWKLWSSGDHFIQLNLSILKDLIFEIMGSQLFWLFKCSFLYGLLATAYVNDGGSFVGFPSPVTLLGKIKSYQMDSNWFPQVFGMSLVHEIKKYGNHETRWLQMTFNTVSLLSLPSSIYSSIHLFHWRPTAPPDGTRESHFPCEAHTDPGKGHIKTHKQRDPQVRSSCPIIKMLK